MTASTTRICEKGGVPLDTDGKGPTQRVLQMEREMDVQEMPKDYKRHPDVNTENFFDLIG